MSSRRQFLGGAFGLGAATVVPTSQEVKKKIELDRDNPEHYWLQKNDEEIFIGDMGDGHLFNTVGMLINRSDRIFELTGKRIKHPKLDILQSELSSREDLKTDS